MGAGQSTSNAHPPSRALHVLRVTPSSPASHTNIEPFFDFIVGFEGDPLASGVGVSQLEKIVEDHEGRILNLLVWNSKHQVTRVVPVIPSRSWSHSQKHANGNQVNSGPRPSLLGLNMRMCEPEVSMDMVWHVLDVLEGSPAESAGLVPYGDWIVGWSGGVLKAENDFYDLVEEHIDRPLRVYVYSYDFDTLREVVLVPNRQWGGEGLLGCVFGFGLLHRIPSGQERMAGVNTIESDETVDGYEEQELFVPTNHELSENTPRSHIVPQYIRHTPHPPDGAGYQEATHSSSPRNSPDTDHTHIAHSHRRGLNSEETSSISQASAAQVTPRRVHPAYSMPTPIRSPSFGTIMNGPSTARLLSPRAGTPVTGFRSALSPSWEDQAVDKDGDADYDGEMSTTSTSDTHSLTSVE